MNAPLEGVRVVEVASHVFVPLAGSVLRSGARRSSRNHHLTVVGYFLAVSVPLLAVIQMILAANR
jgi:hypothetical protein